MKFIKLILYIFIYVKNDKLKIKQALKPYFLFTQYFP